jgi:hypothetical protein
MNLKWRKGYWLIVYGLLGYLLFIVIQLPASIAWRQVPASIKQTISINSLEGSIWSATATGVMVNGHALGKMAWHLSPLALITGHLGGDVQIRHPLGTLQGDFEIDNKQIVELHNLQGKFNAALLEPLARPMMLNGQFNIDIDDARLKRASLLEINGTAQWHDAALSGIQDLELGQILVKAVPNAGGSRLQVSNQNGVIKINGEITLAPNGHYNLNLSLLNRDKRRKELDTVLGMLGKPDTSGRVNFRQAGIIPGFR